MAQGFARKDEPLTAFSQKTDKQKDPIIGL